MLFYIFFEFGLVPMFLIIDLGRQFWHYAAFKFFLHPAGFVLMLAAILFMIGSRHHLDPRPMTYTSRLQPGCGSPSSRPSR